MIETLLAQLGPEAFFADYFQRQPYSEPGTAADAIPLLTWDKIAYLLTLPQRPDLIISRNGKFLENAEPADMDAARTLFESGCSIVCRNIERFDSAAKMLQASFEAVIEGQGTVHTFSTPGRTIGFGWHYDCEDVFILQTAGTKEYYLRRNTVNPQPTLDDMPRDMHFEKETTPTIACTLVPGDWLYIPRGWWHLARALDDSLGLSVGILSPEARGKSAPSHRQYR